MFLLIPEKPVLFILLDEFALYSSFGNFFNVWLKKRTKQKVGRLIDKNFSPIFRQDFFQKIVWQSFERLR